MVKLILKSIISGFVLGTVLFVVAPLGLAIYFIEYLKPVLIPGVSLAQFFLGNTDSITPMILAFIFNGLIYSIPFLGFSLIRAYVAKKKETELS
jgi:hypothetical protein